ncbi:MAG: hypothetical protein ABIP53_00325 [Candidatus Limnocylindrales bacterium]
MSTLGNARNGGANVSASGWIGYGTFALEPTDDNHTRFVFRTRDRVSPWWAGLAYRAVVIPADFVMSRQMLRGVRGRAEQWRRRL